MIHYTFSQNGSVLLDPRFSSWQILKWGHLKLTLVNSHIKGRGAKSVEHVLFGQKAPVYTDSFKKKWIKPNRGQFLVWCVKFSLQSQSQASVDNYHSFLLCFCSCGTKAGNWFSKLKKKTLNHLNTFGTLILYLLASVHTYTHTQKKSKNTLIMLQMANPKMWIVDFPFPLSPL